MPHHSLIKPGYESSTLQQSLRSTIFICIKPSAASKGRHSLSCDFRGTVKRAGWGTYNLQGSSKKWHCSVAEAASDFYTAPPLPVSHNGVIDYYELLGVDDDATQGEIKMAYRNLAKECHPDYLGVEGHNICILLNEAYEILGDPGLRTSYNQQLQTALIEAMDDYTGKPLSKWLVGHKLGKTSDAAEDRAIFVDECSCVGCKQCVWLAPGVYRIEPEYGRSRVFAQWANTEDEIQASIDSCPVDCISWVSKEQLPALEYVTRNRTSRRDVASMMSGMGAAVDVFAVADRFLKNRLRREKDRKKTSRRSEAQEQARRSAAFSLLKKRGGWMSDFSSYMEAAFAGVARSVDSSMDEDIGLPIKVGLRKRRVPGTPLDDETGATIPIERSLIRRE